MDEKLFHQILHRMELDEPLDQHTMKLADCGRTLQWNVTFLSNVNERFLRLDQTKLMQQHK